MPTDIILRRGAWDTAQDLAAAAARSTIADTVIVRPDPTPVSA